MLNRLRNLLRSASADADRFVRDLGVADLFVIGSTDSEGIDAKTLTGDTLLAAIRAELERDQERQQSGYGLFSYTTAAGERRLPFFTTSKHAERFCGEYSKERDRVFPFMVLQTRGTFLAKVRLAHGQIAVLNDKCPDERVLSAAELAAARRMWT